MIGSRLRYIHVIEKLFNANFAFKRCEYVSICIFNQEMTLIQLLLWVNPIQAGLFWDPVGGGGGLIWPPTPQLLTPRILRPMTTKLGGQIVHPKMFPLRSAT